MFWCWRSILLSCETARCSPCVIFSLILTNMLRSTGKCEWASSLYIYILYIYYISCYVYIYIYCWFINQSIYLFVKTNLLDYLPRYLKITAICVRTHACRDTYSWAQTQTKPLPSYYHEDKYRFKDTPMHTTQMLYVDYSYLFGHAWRYMYWIEKTCTYTHTHIYIYIYVYISIHIQRTDIGIGFSLHAANTEA